LAKLLLVQQLLGGYWGGTDHGLLITLQGEAASELGSTIEALDLAIRIMEFWRVKVETPERDNAG